MRLLMLAAAGTIFFLFFYSSGLRTGNDADVPSNDDFYAKTKKAMDEGTPPGQAVLDSQTGQKAGHIPADKDADGDVDEDDKVVAEQMQERLKAAEQEAKDKANEKGGLRPDPPSHVVGVGSSAEGQKKEKEEKLEKSGKAAKVVDDDDLVYDKDHKVSESKLALKAEAELNTILKKSPGTLFASSS